MSHIVRPHGLTKKFKEQTAVEDINLAIQEGEIYGLVGRKGAGKTSFMKMISGLSHPASGGFSLFRTKYCKTSNKGMYMQVRSLIEAPGSLRICRHMII